MSSHVVGRRLLRTVPLVGLVLASVGCPEDAAQITEQPSAASQEFPITGSFVSPTGSFALNRFQFAAFDSTVTDAFSRSVVGPGGLGLFATDPFFGFPGWRMWDTGRNSAEDPRLPALAGTGTESVRRFCGLWGPGFGGGEFVWDLFCEMEGVTPSTRFTIMLARYATRINGSLDAAEMLLTGAVTTPDELVLLDGTPQGYPTTPCDFSTFVSPIVDANPLVLGFADSGSGGLIQFIDCLIDANGIWWASTDGPPPPGAADSATFAPNRQIAFSLPKYNYVVLVQGQGDAVNPVPAGPHVFRWQLGPDILEDGTPINNGLAPFPTAAFTDDQLVAANGGAGKVDSMTVTLNTNSLELLDTLANPRRYEAWLVDAGSGAAIPATGRYQRLQGTTVVEDVAGTNTFAGGEGFSHRLILSDAGLGGGATDSLVFYSHVVLTIDDSPGDAIMAAAQPFWSWYNNRGDPGTLFDDVFTPQGTTTRFGRLDLTNPAASVPFGGQGSGEGSVREGILNIDLAALSRPPVGYVYAAWLLGPDTVQLPAITGPLPEGQSLVDADEQTIPGLVTENGILEANFRLDSNAAAIDLSQYGTFRVTLEPKVGAAKMSATRTLTGTPP